MMKITKHQVELIYEEMERRCEMDDVDIVIIGRHGKTFSDDFCGMLQGMYSALIMIADNWSEVTFWMQEIEEKYFT